MQPAVQFCTDAFSEYVRLTDADALFGQQFKNLEFFRYFWQYNVFLFTILGFALLTLIYLSIFPSDREHLNKARAALESPGDRGHLIRMVLRRRGSLLRRRNARLNTTHHSQPPPARPCARPPPQVMQAIKAKKGVEMKNLDRKLAQQGGALSVVQGADTGRKK